MKVLQKHYNLGIYIYYINYYQISEKKMKYFEFSRYQIYYFT